MTLAGMLAMDRDAVACDLAETYHVYDMRALPVQTVATLACGLHSNARIMLIAAGLKEIPPEFVLVKIHDLFLRYIYGMAKKKPKKAELLGEEIRKKKEETAGRTKAAGKGRKAAGKRSLYKG